MWRATAIERREIPAVFFFVFMLIFSVREVMVKLTAS